MSTEKKAKELFEQFRKEQGMDNDDVRACTWHKEGMIDAFAWLLEKLATPAANQEKEIVWEEIGENDFKAVIGDYELRASKTINYTRSFAYHQQTLLFGSYLQPDLPSAKAAAEKAYREHIKQNP